MPTTQRPMQHADYASGGPDNLGSGESLSDVNTPTHFFNTSAVHRTCHTGSCNNERHHPTRNVLRSEIHPAGVRTRPSSISSIARALPAPTSCTIFIHICAMIVAGLI